MSFGGPENEVFLTTARHQSSLAVSQGVAEVMLQFGRGKSGLLNKDQCLLQTSSPYYSPYDKALTLCSLQTRAVVCVNFQAHCLRAKITF